MEDDPKRPHVPQKSPYVMELEPGRYAWCACGRSKSQPFCDGSHKGTQLTPLLFEVEEECRAAICGCKHTKSGGPFCDGSHKQLD
jgi:CDGSH iron-sulfur domain-containing protein 3